MIGKWLGLDPAAILGNKLARNEAKRSKTNAGIITASSKGTIRGMKSGIKSNGIHN